MIHTDENEFKYYASLDEARKDGYSPVKVGSVVEFFTLAGKPDSESTEKVKQYASELMAKSDTIKKGSAMNLAKKHYGIYTGASTDLAKDNFIPIPDLKYMVLNGQDCYYVRDFNKNWTLDMLFFYRKSLDFSGDDEAVNSLRNAVEQQRVWLLFDKDTVKKISDLLTRLYKANLEGEGKLPYRTYVKIVIESLKYEDYKIFGRNTTGFKTACRLFEERIGGLYKQAYELNNKQT